MVVVFGCVGECENACVPVFTGGGCALCILCACVSADASSSSKFLFAFFGQSTVKRPNHFFALAKHGNQEDVMDTHAGPSSCGARQLAGWARLTQPHSWQVCADLIAHGWQGSGTKEGNKTDNKRRDEQHCKQALYFPSTE